MKRRIYVEENSTPISSYDNVSELVAYLSRMLHRYQTDLKISEYGKVYYLVELTDIEKQLVSRFEKCERLYYKLCENVFNKKNIDHRIWQKRWEYLLDEREKLQGEVNNLEIEWESE